MSNFTPAPFKGGSGTGGAPDWKALTAVTANELRRATAEVGTIKIGDLIRSNTARTTGAIFDSTEAANWTEVSWDTPIIDNLTSNTPDWALSANQGRILDSKVTVVDGRVTDVNTDLQDFKTKSALILNWTANTVVRANEVRRATATVGDIKIGDIIRSNSARTTGATFNATETPNWTEIINETIVQDNLTTVNTVDALSANQGRLLNKDATAFKTMATADPALVKRIRVRVSGNTFNSMAHLSLLKFIDDTGARLPLTDFVVTTGVNSRYPVITNTGSSDIPRAFDDDPVTWWGLNPTALLTGEYIEAIFTLPTPKKIKTFTMAPFQNVRTYEMLSMDAQFVNHNEGSLADGSNGTWYPIIAPQAFVSTGSFNPTEAIETGYQPDLKTVIEDSLTSTSKSSALSANQGLVIDSKLKDRFSRNIKRIRIRLTNNETNLGAHLRVLDIRRLDGTRITTSDFSITTGNDSNVALTFTGSTNGFTNAVNIESITGASNNFWTLGNLTTAGKFQEAVITLPTAIPLQSISIGTFNGNIIRYFGLQVDVEFEDEAGLNDDGWKGNFTNILPMQQASSATIHDNVNSTFVLGNLFKEYYTYKRDETLQKRQEAVILGAGNRVFNGAAEMNDTTDWYNIPSFSPTEIFSNDLMVVEDADFGNGKAFWLPVNTKDYRYTHKAVACSPSTWHSFEFEYSCSGDTTDGFTIRILEMPHKPEAGYINVTNSSATAQSIFLNNSPLTTGIKRFRGRFNSLSTTKFCSIEIIKANSARNVEFKFGSVKITPISDIRYTENLIINSGAGYSRTHFGQIVGLTADQDTAGWFYVQGTDPTFTSVSNYQISKRGAAFFKLGNGVAPTASGAWGYHRISLNRDTGYAVGQVYYVAFWARASVDMASGFTLGCYESDGLMTGDFVTAANNTAAQESMVNNVGLGTEWEFFELLYAPNTGMLHVTPFFRRGTGAGTADIYLDDIQFREVT